MSDSKQPADAVVGSEEGVLRIPASHIVDGVYVGGHPAVRALLESWAPDLREIPVDTREEWDSITAIYEQLPSDQEYVALIMDDGVPGHEEAQMAVEEFCGSHHGWRLEADRAFSWGYWLLPIGEHLIILMGDVSEGGGGTDSYVVPVKLLRELGLPF